MEQLLKRYGTTAKVVDVQGRGHDHFSFCFIPLLSFPHTSLVLSLYLFSFCFIPLSFSVPVETALVNLTGSSTPLVRLNAVRTLGERREDARALPALTLAFSREPEPAIRQAILAVLQSFPDPAVDPFIVQAASSDPSPNVRGAAVRSLGERPWRVETLPVLVRALEQDQAATVRQAAAQMMMRPQARSAKATLQRAAKEDTDESVRQAAQFAVNELAEPAEMDPAIVGKDDEAEVDPNLKNLAWPMMAALFQMDQLPELIQELAKEDLTGRQSSRFLIRNFLKTRADEALPALVTALEDPSPKVRFEVTWLLKDHRDPSLPPALTKLLEDAHPAVRAVAAVALHNMGRYSASSLRSDFGGGGSGAPGAASSASGRDVIPPLKLSLKDTQPLTRLWAAWALDQIGLAAEAIDDNPLLKKRR